MKYKIEYVKNKTKYGYIGMNFFASQEHSIPFVHRKPEHTLIIYKKVPHDVRITTIKHEEVESFLMKNKHMHYHPAHDIALKYEEDPRRVSKIIKELNKKYKFKINKRR